jgi:rhodanese-related sulfurtransferase
MKKLNSLFQSSLFLILLLSLFSLISAKDTLSHEKEYVCFPCGSECDEIIQDSPGSCSVCNMELIEKSRVKFENLTPEKVAEIISSDNEIILLDVRTPEEFEGKGDKPRFSYGHLVNAINIPNTELIDRISEIEIYKDREIIVYCSHSHRSPYACQQLTDLGFTNIKNMSEGLSSFVLKDLKNPITGESLLIK